MLKKTCSPVAPLIKLGCACIAVAVLFTPVSKSYAQGSDVDLSQPAERASETDSDLQTESADVVRLYFTFGAETLETSSLAALQRLADQALDNPNITFLIESHTDNRGWALGNMELSRIRARSIAKRLMDYGIVLTRMRAFAFGESRPIAKNKTAEGRRLNRRVEVSLIP